MKTYQTHPHRLTKLTLICLTILLFPVRSHARDLSFSWTTNPEPLISYKLYYKTGDYKEAPYDGTGLNEGDSPITIGKVTTFEVTGLSPNKTYHFTLTALDEIEESGYADVLSFDPLPFTPPTIKSMSQN